MHLRNIAIIILQQAVLLLLIYASVSHAQHKTQPCALDFHVDVAAQNTNRTNETLYEIHTARELHASRPCINASEQWFYSNVGLHTNGVHGDRVDYVDAYDPEDEGPERNAGPTHAVHVDRTVGAIRCDGITCIPPFWSWWSVVRAQCELELVGRRAQRLIDRAPWDSGAQWSPLQGLSMAVEDTYLMLDGQHQTAYVWHCRMFPRVYSAESIECTTRIYNTNDSAFIDDQRVDLRVDDVQQQCVLNVYVGRGVHLLLYIISAFVLVGACGIYACCMWACYVCCGCASLCERWLPCMRPSARSMRVRRAMRDAGPDGDGVSSTHRRSTHHNIAESSWEMPGAKSAGFARTFARLARAGSPALTSAV